MNAVDEDATQSGADVWTGLEKKEIGELLGWQSMRVNRGAF